MKRPLVSVAISYALGLLLADHMHPPVAALFIAGFGLIAAAFLRRSWAPRLLLPVVFVAGWTNLAWRADVIPPLDLRNHFIADAQIVSLRGRLWWPPERRVYSHGDKETVRTMAWLETEAARPNGGEWRAVTGRVLALTRGELPDGARRHARVEITGVLAPPPGPEARGLFDYRKYLSRQFIYYQLRADGAQDWEIIKAREPDVSGRFIAWAKAVLGRGIPETDPSLPLLWSMSLGARSSLEHEDYAPFIRTGTMHIFAISGLHVALISGMLVAALRSCRLPRRWCGIIAVPLIWFYTAATGWQPSAVRAAIMSTVVLGGWALARPTDLVNSLCAAALIILVWDPQQLFGASFQLSFFVVLSIALLLPALQTARDRWLRHDPFLHPDLVPRWKRWLHACARSSTNALGISLAAWLGALPLTVYYFHLLNPVTLLANLLVVPASSVALGCNMAALLTGDWLWPLTEALNRVAVLFMRLIVRLCDTWSGPGWGTMNIRSLLLPEVAAYYAVLLGVFSGWFMKGRRGRWTLAGVPALAAGWLGILSQWHSPAAISILPLEGGMAVHSRVQGRDTLIDCGRTNSYERLVAPLLQARGVNRLDTLILSHGDLGDMGAARLAAGQFQPRRICAGPLKFRSPVYRECVRHFSDEGRLSTLSLGASADCWHVLHPMPDDRVSQADEGALVLSAEIQGARVLFLSDLNRAGQETLLNRHTDLRADVVIAGMPSQDEPLCDALLDRIRPEIIIVGDSTPPAYNRARPELAKRLRASGARVVLASEAGVTEIRFAKGRHAVECMGGLEGAGE
jgi:ComEC/Rec2-related protein